MKKELAIKTVKDLATQQVFFMFRIKKMIYNQESTDIANIYAYDTLFKTTILNPYHKFYELLGGFFYDKIVDSYNIWFEDCEKIYQMLYKEPKNIKKPKIKSISESDLDILKSRFDDLQNTSAELVTSLNDSNERLNALSSDKFPA